MATRTNCDGINPRHMGDGRPVVPGYDTPEVRGRKCRAGLVLAWKAKPRMRALPDAPGIQTRDTGQRDTTGGLQPVARWSGSNFRMVAAPGQS